MASLAANRDENRQRADGRQLRRDREGVRSPALVISAAKIHTHWYLEL